MCDSVCVCAWVWLGYVTLFYSSTNMCMLVNKAAAALRVPVCVCVLLCVRLMTK